MWRKVDYYWLQFVRFGLCIDRYCAERSGNKEMYVDTCNRIFRIDREIELWALNH